MPAPKTAHVVPRLDLGGEHRGAQPGRETAREETGPVRRRLRRNLGERDLRQQGERRGAHEVADPLAVPGEPGGPIGQVAEVLLLADREAEVGLRAAAVNALTALRGEERDDPVTRRHRLHTLADALDDARAFVPEHGRRVA
jgi:hypothetical protein